MIQAFKELGEKELIGLSASEKKRKFLETQTLVPNVPASDNEDADKYQEVVINLDTEKEEIEIKQGKELHEEHREEFFGFDLKSGNSSKTFFTSNRRYYHLLTIPHLIYYIEKEFDKDRYENFLRYLKKLENIFYITERDSISNRPSDTYLNINKFKLIQNKKINEYIEKDFNKAQEKNKQKKIDELEKLKENKPVDYKVIRRYFKKLISDILGTSQKFVKDHINIFSLKINGKYITETDYKDEYVDVVHYILQQRFFDESENMVNEKALCGVCNKITLVTGKIDMNPIRLHVTSSPNFFENLKKDNAYRAFAICQDCYQQVMVGIAKVRKDYSSQLFSRLNYYLIPKDIGEDYDYERELRWIEKILSYEQENYSEEIKLLKDIKKRALKFEFLFWYKPEGQGAAFVASDSINEVYYSDLKEIFSKLRSINLNGLYKELPRELKPKLNSIYWLLFPNYKSHVNSDSKLYRKELLNLLNSILKKRDIDYKYLVDNFVFIFRKRYFKNKKNIKDIIYNPLQMNILLSWLNSINELKGGSTMVEGSSMIEIEDEDIKEFFKVHADIYEGNVYRQGLFILGKLMNEVLKEQQKQGKSANILDKLSFDGLPTRRVKKFVKDITEILNIYDKYGVNQLLHAQMMDRLQGIENSSLNKDEVVFYILSGLSFGRYLGHKYNKGKKKGD